MPQSNHCPVGGCDTMCAGSDTSPWGMPSWAARRTSAMSSQTSESSPFRRRLARMMHRQSRRVTLARSAMTMSLRGRCSAEETSPPSAAAAAAAPCSGSHAPSAAPPSVSSASGLGPPNASEANDRTKSCASSRRPHRASAGAPGRPARILRRSGRSGLWEKKKGADSSAGPNSLRMAASAPEPPAYKP
eukprot:CAMPEP_0203862090 /NCGR_PEP_ID=MMETSP0359-20131031/13389_1 /ASSEMBLY_ACC=CAM_ASM_000338 /TAXON_ID=268821 /ORGANISM="Scrippsiella Hangoei, Strain SHTV-5" /LENGTH=188 /DNA_ID=CAMNT_0050779427 /DNA_START=28 /DNA_END=595 /DNA_ORIENTATION=-